jgi:ABC-type uncharacterized transport system involved in gliding motility auxiliary subunit
MKNLKKNFITNFVISAGLLGGIVILINMIFNNINIGRFDLTADKIYKLSSSVNKILSQLEAPIELTYYVSSSEKMPTMWKNLERDVIDKLKELELASNGKLSYTVFDPSAEEEKEAYEELKEKEEEDNDSGFMQSSNKKKKISRKKIAEQLYEKGVIPFGVQSTQRDEFAVKRVYSSIVLSYLDRKEDVIEEIRPENFGNIEYEIMSRIYKLIANSRPKVGFYPGKPETPPHMRQYYNQEPPDLYESAVQVIKGAGYDVTRTNITKDDPVPEDIKTMVIMVDQPLEDRQMYEIDKMIHNGVRIILGAQQYNYQITPSEPGEFDVQGMTTRININNLIKNYGFELDDQMFMDRSSAYIQIPVYNTRSMGMFQIKEQRLTPVTKPIIIKINPENINPNLSISNKIMDLFYLFGGRMLIDKDLMKENDQSYKVLFTSSNYCWTKVSRGFGPVDVSPPVSSDEILKRQPLAIFVEGKFKAKYTEGNIPKWPKTPPYAKDEDDEEDEEEEPDVPTEITGDSRANKIIAFGSSNIFKSDILQAAVSHRTLLLNSIDALTLGDELINIRSKNIVARRIKTTSSVGKAVSKGFVIWFTPIVFVAIGIVLNIKRKRK